MACAPAPAAQEVHLDSEEQKPMLREVVTRLLEDLRSGAGDRDKRRQVEEWMKTLAEKYPGFEIEQGLRAYYLAEADRLREEFDSSPDLTQRLALARAVEMFLDRAADMARRIQESGESSSGRYNAAP